MGAAQHQGLDRRGLVGGGRLQERSDVGADDVADGRLDRRVAFDRGGQSRRPELSDWTSGDLGDGLGIRIRGAGPYGGEHGHPALRTLRGLREALRAGFDDADDDDRDTPGLHGGADVFEPVSRGGIAGDDDRLHRRLHATGVATAEQEQGVTQDEFTQEVGPSRRSVVAVRHVRLVAEIDEALAVEIRHAVRALLTRAIVMTVVGLEGLENRQAADAGVEDADRQVAEVATVIRRDEAGRDIALGMGLGMADRDRERVIRRA